MTPQQKAEELSKRYSKPVHGTGDCEYETYAAALEMSAFKDAQLEKYLCSTKEILQKTLQMLDDTYPVSGCQKLPRKVKKIVNNLEIEIKTIDSIISDLHNGKIWQNLEK